MKRRQFLSLGLQSIPLLMIGPTLSAESVKLSLQHATLLALIDTLIPADETPSASQLGLDRRLIHHAQSIENYTALLALGCQWLDGRAQAHHNIAFHQITDIERQAVVALAETSPAGSIPRQFFDHVRADLFTFYYSHPDIWPNLGLQGAPQPYGYPDYAAAPRNKA